MEKINLEKKNNIKEFKKQFETEGVNPHYLTDLLKEMPDDDLYFLLKGMDKGDLSNLFNKIGVDESNKIVKRKQVSDLLSSKGFVMLNNWEK